MVELRAAAPAAYLGTDEVVDHDHASVAALAARLRASHADDVAFARAAFEHVRDQVAHSVDVQDPRVTVTASDALREGVGLCFAKSHLLAALLRAQGVPAGFCYQRLLDDAVGFSLHGLVAVHLEGGWRRLDPRGNNALVDAQFSLVQERLAWPVDPARGEEDYLVVLPEPAAVVVAALRGATGALELCRRGLPDRLPD